MDTPLRVLAEQSCKLASEQELLDAGYEQFPLPFDHSHAHGAFAKRLRAYVYCTIYSYSAKDAGVVVDPNDDMSFQMDAQLRNDRKCYNIELLATLESLAEIEAFLLGQAEWFESRYGRLGSDDDD